ncbi:hypothetical protein HG530_011591 [Fusarium avenaceum]|nr:hypothetical protein HG530_011591 [Fusarium avenaceum]
MHRNAVLLAQPNFLTRAVDHFGLVVHNRLFSLFRNNLLRVPERLYSFECSESVLECMIESLSSLKGHRMRCITSQRHPAPVVVPLVLWQAWIPVAELGVPHFCVIWHPGKNAFPGVGKFFSEFLLMGDKFTVGAGVDIVDRLWEGDVMEKCPVFRVILVIAVVKTEPGAGAIWVRTNLVKRAVRLRSKKHSMLLGVSCVTHGGCIRNGCYLGLVLTKKQGSNSGMGAICSDKETTCILRSVCEFCCHTQFVVRVDKIINGFSPVQVIAKAIHKHATKLVATNTVEFGGLYLG